MYHFKAPPYRTPQQSQKQRQPEPALALNMSGSSDDASTGFSLESSETTMTKLQKSQARAAQMQALYELSSDKDLSLNKTANFGKGAVFGPTLRTVSPKQAVAAYRQRERESEAKRKEDGPDPLLQEHEKKELERQKIVAQRHEAQIKHTIPLASGRSNYGSLSPGGSQNQHHSAATPGLVRNTARLEATSTTIQRNNAMNDSEPKDTAFPVRRTGSGGLALVDRGQQPDGVVASDSLLRHADSQDSTEEKHLTLATKALSLATTNNNLATGRSTYGTLQRQGSRNMHHSAMTPSLQKYAKPANSNTISETNSNSRSQQYGRLIRNKTLDDDDTDDFTTDDGGMLSIQRTGSGGLMMLGFASDSRSKTKKALNDKDAFNKARALEMQAMLEMNDDRDMSLNRAANLKVKTTEYAYAPKVQTVSPKAAAEAFQKKQQNSEKYRKDFPDPLLVGHQKREKETQEKIAKRKNTQEASKENHMAPLSRTRKGSSSKSPTRLGAHQQKEEAQHGGYKASNGKVYDLPTLC
mmetsp:Transcript_3449/g.5743  ORF Transcript_3449/g.5743 Transcript_3449/m.5743 type:complete len:525 (-) Transcript_3449:257-1831(-)|eukprot:CAMPEP_0119019874 /NCGR_PEP_ID=MMETSP1176-20130426/22881_1 /TAXON_ID=265551 /ORGANISM="Synedropsis recta cf, Strain CCMP1620" /LENGTH=524 /DNA_ID=CAMNT_0006974191 /DNA_START=52 /DNA_END=1626 /DNA_ORIENTATION=+